MQADKIEVETSGEGVVNLISRSAEPGPGLEPDGNSISVAPMSLDDPKAPMCLGNQRASPAVGPAFAVLVLGSGIFLFRAARHDESPGDEQPPAKPRQQQVDSSPPPFPPQAHDQEGIKALLRVPWRPALPTSSVGESSSGHSGDEGGARSDEAQAVPAADAKQAGTAELTRHAISTHTHSLTQSRAGDT